VDPIKEARSVILEGVEGEVLEEEVLEEEVLEGVVLEGGDLIVVGAMAPAVAADRVPPTVTGKMALAADQEERQFLSFPIHAKL
jgi:hypothetical protein